MATISLDSPRLVVSATTTTKLKGAVCCTGKFCCGRFPQWDQLLAPLDEVRRIHAEVGATVGIDAELEHLADARVAVNPLVCNAVAIVVNFGRAVDAGGDIAERDGALRLFAVLVLNHIDEIEFVAWP